MAPPRRRVATADVDAHLDWLRVAVADPQINTRLILQGILDVLVALAGRLPGRNEEEA